MSAKPVKNILLLARDTIKRTRQRVWLEQLGCKVDDFKTEAEVVSLLHTGRYDLAIINLSDDFEAEISLARMIRERRITVVLASDDATPPEGAREFKKTRHPTIGEEFKEDICQVLYQ